jgi:hypothetical protein
LSVRDDAVDRRREGTRSRRRAIVAAISSLTAAAATAASVPDRLRLIAQIEIAIVGAIAVMIATGELRRAAPLPPPSPLDRRPSAHAATDTALPLDLVRISRRLAAAEASAADARRHLGPLVSEVAADRLRGHSHTRVDHDSVYAQLPRPVPPELTLVLDPALAGLDTRQMPGLDARGSDALVRALEDL